MQDELEEILIIQYCHPEDKQRCTLTTPRTEAKTVLLSLCLTWADRTHVI